MADRDKTWAALQRLPWQQREAVFEATSSGRAVDHLDAAKVAAEWAHATRRRLLRLYVTVLGPIFVAAFAVALIVVARSGGDDGAVVFAFLFTFVLTSLLIWAISLRPLLRSEKANLAKAGLIASGPAKRDGSHWVIAALIAWPVAAIVGALVAVLHVHVPWPVGFLAWFIFTLFAKRTLDDRAA